MGENHRQHDRLKGLFLVKYHSEEAGQEPKITNVRDISAGGLRFVTKELLNSGTAIKVSLLIPALNKSFDAKATILRVQKQKKGLYYSTALRFDDLSSTEEEVINSYIKQLALDQMSMSINEATVTVK